MDSFRAVSGFDATQYRHPSIRDEVRARAAVLAHFEAMRSARDDSGALLAVVGPASDLEALRVLAPRDSAGAMWCVGRHAFADIRLQSSVEAPLRALALHVVVRPVPSVRVIDLQTPTGFFVRGVGPCRDISLTSPALIELAGYSLVVVPPYVPALSSRGAMSFWDALAHPLVQDVALFGEAAESDDEPVTVMRSRPREEANGAIVRVGFELVFASSQVMTGVSPAELRRGVLCGRYARCSLGGRALRNMLNVSRVHLLVQLAGETLRCFDLATTSGTTLNGVPRRFFALAPRDVVELGGEVQLKVVG